MDWSYCKTKFIKKDTRT